jgi:hypothetical protein
MLNFTDEQLVTMLQSALAAPAEVAP